MTPIDPRLEHPANTKRLLGLATLAKRQPEYEPLPSAILNVAAPERNIRIPAVVTRWRLTEREIADLLAGKDLYLTVVTFGQPLQPVHLQIGEGECVSL